ncbi:MAG: glycosyltransferase family 4 protein [Candidatus Eisenbacteria bacterium]
MRILIVNRKAFPSIGGKQLHTTRLAAGLAGLGHDVSVVATHTDPPAVPTNLGFPIHYRPKLERLHRLVADADVVHLNIHSWPVLFFGLLLRKPMLYVYHESGDRLCGRALTWRWWEPRCRFEMPCLWCEQTRFRRSPRHWLLDPLAQRARDRFVTVVGTCRVFLSRLPADSPYVPYGLPMDELVPAASPRRDFLLFAARLTPEKGGVHLIRAVAECRRRGQNFPVVVLGDGPERGDLERLAQELEVADRVEFRGAVSMSVLIQHYQQAFAVVLPSVWEEMFGTISVEAMACRTPVIASAVGGMVETVGHAGLLFPPGDHVALADRILEVKGDPSLAESLAQRGFELAHSQYELSTMVRNYEGLYGRLVVHEDGDPEPTVWPAGLSTLGSELVARGRQTGGGSRVGRSAPSQVQSVEANRTETSGPTIPPSTRWTQPIPTAPWVPARSRNPASETRFRTSA